MTEYKENIRGIEEIHKYGGVFYEEILDEFGGFSSLIESAYDGYENFPDRLCNKTPNITRIWNLPFSSKGFLYGSSLGHKHSNYDFDVQEIYQFNGDGGMLISSEDCAKLYLCEYGDKVIVPSDIVMTIFNLSYKTLLTVDMANPFFNKSSKDVIKKNGRGPMIGVIHTGENSRGYFSDFYLRGICKKNVEIPMDGKVKFRLNKNYDLFGIRESIDINLDISDKRHGLINAIWENKDKFIRYNVEIIKAEPFIKCEGRDCKSYLLEGDLVDLSTENNKNIHRILGMV